MNNKYPIAADIEIEISDRGPQGARGFAGPMGPTGPKGTDMVAGDTNVSVELSEKTVTTIFTIINLLEKGHSLEEVQQQVLY